MRKIIVIAFILGLAVLAAGAHSHANGSPQWVTGKVVSIVTGTDGSLLSMELPGGELFSVPSAPGLLEGIQAGDVVTVQVVEGQAMLLRIAEKAAPSTPAPEKKDDGVQWVPGEVVSMEKGPTDSLLSVRMSDGTVFNVATSNDKIKGIKVGDHVIAKVFQGWAQSVTKK
ncbi:MAG: hypothetical protein R3B51_03150 [Thermodesulfobacteriota bacterium]